MVVMAHGDITHVDIPVSDKQRSAEFFKAVFGWQVSTIPGMEDYPMWTAPNGVSGGGLAPRSEGFTQPRSTVEVDSIEETLATVTANGGTVLFERSPITDTSWWAVFRDPDGNEIGLYEGTTEAS